MITLPQDGERFIPTQSNAVEVLVNLERYHYAASKCIDQKVLELGCGCGLGTYLYSLVAKSVYAVDYSEDAIRYAEQYPFIKEKVSFGRFDLSEHTPLGKFDVVVATEFLEHIENPKKLLAELDTKYLVFSLPIDSLKVSTWHKFDIPGGKDGTNAIKALIEDKYHIEDILIQQERWVYGYARKRKSWL